MTERPQQNEIPILELKFAPYAPKVWEKLAQIPRTGWVNREVPNPENVQEHVLAMRNLVAEVSALIPEFSPTDIQDILDMIEVHDWAEVITGDEAIVEWDLEVRKKLKDAKAQREYDAMVKICNEMGEAGKKVFKIWHRYEERNDPLAIFAKEIDSVQAIEKAFEYETAGHKVSVKQFMDYLGVDVRHPVLKKRIEKYELSQ